MPADYESLTTGAGYVTLDAQTLAEVSGTDRAAFLHNLCTNDIRKLTPGAGCEAFFTNVQGKILAFVNVYCGEESLIIESVPGQADTLLPHLDRYLIREDVQLHDRTNEWAAMIVAGDQVAESLASILDKELPTTAWQHITVGVAEQTVSIARWPAPNAPMWLLRCERGAEEMVQHALRQCGVATCGQDARDVLRVEGGQPLYGRDITDANLPQEVDRDATAISFIKGCYLGQETVARIDALGHVNKILRGVRVEGDVIPAAGTALTVNDKEVGRVTSAVFSPKLGAPLALAFVRRGHEAVGTRLNCGDTDAVVIELPA